MQTLNVQGCKRLKTFPRGRGAYNDTLCSDLTFPFLRKITFEYHAHCCSYENMLTLNRTIFASDQRCQSTVNRGTKSVFHTTRKRSTENYACINTTSGIIINQYTPSPNELFNISELCTLIPFCFQNRCPSNCLNMTDNQSGIGLPDVACILNNMQLSITPTCISPSTSVIQTTVCWSGTIILTPSSLNFFSKMPSQSTLMLSSSPSQSTPTLLPSPSQSTPTLLPSPSQSTPTLLPSSSGSTSILSPSPSQSTPTLSPSPSQSTPTVLPSSSGSTSILSPSPSQSPSTLSPLPSQSTPMLSPSPPPPDYSQCPSGDIACDECVTDDCPNGCQVYQPYCDAVGKKKRDASISCSFIDKTLTSIVTSSLLCATMSSDYISTTSTPSPSPPPSPPLECPDSICDDCVIDDCDSSECEPYQIYCDMAKRKRKRNINDNCSTVTIMIVPSLTFSLNCATLPSVSQSLLPSLSTQSPSPSLPTQSPSPSPPPPPPPPTPDYSQCPSDDTDCEDCVIDDCDLDGCEPYQPYCDAAKRRKRDINSNSTDKSCYLDVWIVNKITTLSPNASICLNPSSSSSSIAHSSSQYPSSTVISTSTSPSPTGTTGSGIGAPSCRPPNVILDGRFYILSQSYVDCQPKNDPFNPCDDIIDSNLLRAAMWLVILLSLGGNIVVITVTSSYFISRYRTRHEQPHLMYFLYINLAIADLFMGIYLLTIAVVDLDTLGEYSLHAVEWQTGPGCRFAGFCAIFSSLLSVYTLLVITIERVYSIKFALQHKRFKKRYAAIVMVIGWIIAIVLSILPMLNVSSYERVSICLPFDTRDTIDKVYVVFILVITGIASFVILISYIILFYLVTCSRSKKDLHGTLSGRDEMKLALRMSLLIITDFACWAPIAFFGLTAVFNVSLIDVSGAKILMVIVFPINSCLNPLLYSFSTRKFRTTLCSIFSHCGLCTVCNRHLKPQSSGPYVATPSDERIDNSELKLYDRTRRRSTQISIMSRLLSLSSTSSDHGSRRGSAFSSGSDDGTFQNGSARIETPPLRSERVSLQSLASEESSGSDPSDTGGRFLRDHRPSLASLGHISQLTALPEEAEEDLTSEVIQNTKVHRDSNTSAESAAHLELNYTPVMTEAHHNQNEETEYEETSFNGSLEDGLCRTSLDQTVPSVYKNDGYLDDVWPMTTDKSLQVSIDDAFSHKSSQESPSPSRKAILPVLLPLQINYDEHDNESQCQKVVFY